MSIKGTYYVQDIKLNSEEKDLLLQHHDNIYCTTIFGRNIKNFDIIAKYSELENLIFETTEYLLKELEIYKLRDQKNDYRDKEEIIAESKQSLKDLIQDIKSYNPEIKIAIDCEGGSVYRLPWSKNNFRNLSEFGELYKIDPEFAKAECYSQYDKIAKELQEFGIDINFAPVLDMQAIDINGNKNFIFNRAVSGNPLIIAEMTSCAIDAMLHNNIISTLKHIPGHGGTLIDTHKNEAVIDKSLEELINEDSLPFKNIAEKYAQEIADGKIIAMLSHIKYNALDPDNIAPMSTNVGNFIKNIIGFKGLLISDAIEMKGLVSFFTKPDPTDDSINLPPDFKFITGELHNAAVVDIILFCGCGIMEKNADNLLFDHLTAVNHFNLIPLSPFPLIPLLDHLSIMPIDQQIINQQSTINIVNITINSYSGE